MKCKVQVKTPTIKLEQSAVEMTVGDTLKLAATTAPKSAASSVTYTSDKPEVADVVDGTVTAKSAGAAVITATAKCGSRTMTATANITVKEAVPAGPVLTAVKQTAVNKIEATVTGDTKDLTEKDFTVTNTATKAVYQVKNCVIDKVDTKKVTLETHLDMKDGKEYTVAFKDVTLSFTATDGTVAGVGLEKTEIVAGKETTINAQTLDKDGVILEKVAYPGNDKVNVKITTKNAGDYTTVDGLYLAAVGNTATADLTYHTGNWDTTTGKETVFESKDVVITAVPAEVIAADGWKVKIGDEGSDFASVKETRLAEGDAKKSAYIQMTDSKNETSTDISDYTFESSNNDTLFVSVKDAEKGEISLTPVKAGTSYIIVKDKSGNAVATLAVEIIAERKPVSLSLSKTSVSVTSGMTLKEEQNIKVSVKDQYGEDVELASDEKYKLTTKSVGGKTGDAGKGFDVSDGTLKDSTFVISAGAIKTGVTATTDGVVHVLDVEVKGVKTQLRVTAKTASKAAVAKVVLELSDKKMDNAITEKTTTSSAIIARAFKVDSKGNKIDIITGSAIGVELSEMKTVTGAAINSDVKVGANGDIKIVVNDITNGTRLAAGAYKVNVKTGAGIVTGKEIDVKENIIITDSQPAVTFKRAKTSASTIAECFEFYYEGKKLDESTMDAPMFYDSDAQTATINESVGKHVVKFAIITVKFGNGNKVVQKVSIGNTVEIN